MVFQTGFLSFIISLLNLQINKFPRPRTPTLLHFCSPQFKLKSVNSWKSLIRCHEWFFLRWTLKNDVQINFCYLYRCVHKEYNKVAEFYGQRARVVDPWSTNALGPYAKLNSPNTLILIEGRTPLRVHVRGICNPGCTKFNAFSHAAQSGHHMWDSKYLCIGRWLNSGQP